jgi:hypothetical protein
MMSRVLALISMLFAFSQVQRSPANPPLAAPRRKWPLHSPPFLLFGTGARTVFRANLSAEEPDRRRDDGCHPAIDERREERLLLPGLHDARARRWLPV